MTHLLLTLAIMGIAMLIMAVGVIFKRPCLRGSCGGPTIFDREGDPLTCDSCPRREELKRKGAAERAGALLPTID